MREVKLPEFDVPKAGRLGKAVDWMVYQLSPTRGQKRYMQRRMLPQIAKMATDRLSSFGGGWEGANKSDPYRKFSTTTLSPDSESEEQLEELQLRCVALYKSDPIAHGAVEGRVTNEVGVGMRPQSRAKETEGVITKKQATAFNSKQELLYRMWSQAGCDRTGAKNFVSVQKTCVRNLANYGEVFVEFLHDPQATGPFPLVVDIVSPRRVETPHKFSGDPLVRLGVRYNEKGRVLGYYVRKFESGDSFAVRPDDFRFVDRLDKSGFVRMCHVFDKVFDGQSRGFPWLAANINRFTDMKDFTEASIISAQVEACLTAFIKVANGSPWEEAEAAATSRTASGGRLEKLSPGSVEYLGQDEDITLADPGRPSGTFAPFMEWCGRTLAAGADYPYELLFKNFFRLTYSSGRLSMNDGHLGFLNRRQMLIDECLIHQWRLMTFQAVLGGFHEDTVRTEDFLDEINRETFMSHIWLGQGWQSTDPEREVKAAVNAVDNNVAARSESLGERGIDFEEFVNTKTEEDRRLVEMEVEIRAHRMELEDAAGLPNQKQDPEDEEVENEPQPAIAD